MVGAVVDTGVVDTVEAWLENARRRHEANEYGELPWAIVEAGIRAMWATEHPSRPVSPPPVNTEGGVDMGVNAGGGQVGSNAGGTSRQRGVIHADEVGGVQARGVRSSAAAGSSQGDVGGRQSSLSPMSATHVTTGGIALSYGYFKFTPERIWVTPLLVGRPNILTWKEAIEPWLEMAGLIGFARGIVATPEEHYPDLRAEFRAVLLLTFAVILRCCLPGVQIALNSCREYLDVGHRAWHFIESTYQVTDALYISQLEEQLSHIRMGEEETATDYCNRARRILATMRMAGVHYSTASYPTHVIKGLTSSYNLLKWLSLAPSTRATLNEDSFTSYILQDEAIQEAERPLELLAQVNYVTPVKQCGRLGQRGCGGTCGWKPTKDAEKKNSVKDRGRGGGSRRRECWLCGDPNHLSFECPDRLRNQPRKEKESIKSSTSAKDADSSAGGKGRDDKEASCSLVGVVERTVSLAPEAGEDFQTMAAAVQVNPEVVLLDSGCSHHLMGTKAAFIYLGPSGDVKHVRGFNRALQDVQGRGTVALQGEARKQVLIPDVLYIPSVRANLLSAGQLKESGVKLQEDGDGMLLISAVGDVLGRASYTGRVLCTDMRPCSAKSTMPTTEVVALRAIVPVMKSTPNRLHARLAHVGMNTIRSSAKHEVATGLDLKSASGADLPCVSCVGRKLARLTFPDQGSDADNVLAVVHVDLCGPFRVAAKDGSLYFLLLKNRKTRYVWVRLVAKKSDALQELVQWLAVTERQTQKSVLMLRSDRGGGFLGKQFTYFVNGNGIVHDLTCPNTPQQNGMAEREMRMVVESVRTMLLHMGVQHHWWHLAIQQAVLVRNYLERSTLQPGTTPYQLLTGKKPDFVSEESKGWELLDIADNWVVTTSDVVFYENMLLKVWKSEHGPASKRTPTIPPMDTSTATLPLLAEVSEPAAEDVEDVPSPFPSPAPCAPPLVADLRGLTPVSASCDEGRSGASPMAPAKSIDGGQRDIQQVNVSVKLTPPGEEQRKEVPPTVVKLAKGATARQQPTGEQAAAEPTTEQSTTGHSAGEPTVVHLDAKGSDDSDDGGEAEESTDSEEVEVQGGPRHTGRLRRPPAFFVPAAFTTVCDVDADDLAYVDAEDDDEDFPELDPDMHTDPEHRWDISTMTVKEALAGWKGKAVKAAMEEEIHSLVGMGTWELVERLPGVNIMKNRWVLTTKYHIDDTVEREKARLVVKGNTQVYGTDYDETYAPVSSYVMLSIFLSIVAVLDLNLMQLDMKNVFLQSKLDPVLYMYQPDYFNDGTVRGSRRCAAGRWLEEEPGRDGALLQSRRRQGDLLDTGLRRRPAHCQQQHRDDGAEGAAGGRLRAARDLASAEVPRAGDHPRQRTPKTPVSVDAYAELTFDDKEAQERQEEEYWQKVGSLQSAAVTTRPDIAFACSKLGSDLTVRSDLHWREVDRCLAYLANTRDTSLEFGGGAESLKLVSYVDADDAGDRQNQTSMGGYYVAATEAGKEGRRLRFLLAEFQQLDARTPTVLRVENKSANTFSEGMGLTGNLKHMKRRQAKVQHMVMRGKFSLRYIPTAEQPADFLTKALHYSAFTPCSVAIGQVRLVDVDDGDDDVQQ
ncbi:unnamed protein product [Closterium sp. NIES-53]